MTIKASIPDMNGWSLDVHGDSEDINAPDAFLWLEVRHKKLRHVILRSEKHLNDIGPGCVIAAITDIVRLAKGRIPRTYRDSFIDFMAAYMAAILEEAEKDNKPRGH